VRARRISPTYIFVSPRRPSFILSVTLIPMETLMRGPISPAGCTFAAFASNVRPMTARIRPLILISCRRRSYSLPACIVVWP
jgi:hypothetical protein